MEFLALGPLEVRHQGRAAAPTAAKDRAFLAELLAHAGLTVTTGHLVDALWGEADALPAKPANAVQIRVTRLRALLRRVAGEEGRARLRTLPGGYRLDVRPAESDAARWESRLAEAATAARDGRWAESLAAHEAAEELWRGDAYAGFDDDEEGGSPCARSTAHRLAELRLVAAEDRAETLLHLGRPAEVVARLLPVAAVHPLRERLQLALLRAVRDTGRPAEALARYGDLRALMSRELGTEPGPQLRALHLELLRGADGTPPPRTAAPSPAAGPDAAPRPRQLPPGPRALVGRPGAVAVLLHALTPHAPAADAQPPAPGPACVVVHGMGGVGKTALALHAAHRVAEHYPDGQVHIRIRGEGRAAAVEAVEAALRALLPDHPQQPEPPAEGSSAAEVQPAAALDTAAARLRSALAGRRVLLVVEDARSPEQLRPLVPADARSALLVTSRARLAELDTAARVHLRPLPDDEALDLLADGCGRPRVEAEPEAAARLVRICGHLPLAIRVAAARLTARPALTVAALTDRLSREHDRLDELDSGDLSVRGCLSVTYRALAASADPVDRDAALAFRGLGALPLAEYGAPVTARLMDASEARARAALERLADAALLDETRLDRYVPHDLVRDLTRELAAGDGAGEATAPAATARALGWYARSVSAIGRLRRPGGHPRYHGLPEPGDVPVPAGDDEVWAWLDAEEPNLLLLARNALRMPTAEAEPVRHLLRIVCSLIHTRGRIRLLLSLSTVAIDLAVRAGDVRSEYFARTDVASAHWSGGRPANGLDQIDRALALARRLADADLEFFALSNRAALLVESERLNEAAFTAAEIIRVSRVLPNIDHRQAEASANQHLGAVYARRDPERALEYLRRSRDLYREITNIDHSSYVYETIVEIGVLQLDLGRPEEALATFEEADVESNRPQGASWTPERDHRIGLARALRDLGETARSLAAAEELRTRAAARGDAHAEGLAARETGHTLAAAGRHEEAREQWRMALARLRAADSREAEAVARLLAPAGQARTDAQVRQDF